MAREVWHGLATSAVTLVARRAMILAWCGRIAGAVRSRLASGPIRMALLRTAGPTQPATGVTQMSKTPKATTKVLTGARGRVAAAKAHRAAQAKAPPRPPRRPRTAPRPPPPERRSGLWPPAARAPASAAPAPRYHGIWAIAAEGAAKGKLPAPPDFSAATDTRFRAKLENPGGADQSGRRRRPAGGHHQPDID